MTKSVDGLVAPEGTYRLVASYVLPPQPAFMAPATTLSSLQPMSNNPANNGQTGSVAVQNPPPSTSPGSTGIAAAAAATAATASSSSTTTQNQANTGSTTNGNSQSSATANGSQTGDGSTYALDSNDFTGSEELKTALKHISMQAPSAWAHAPILPPSKISVASVQQTNVSSFGSLGKKDRQQQQSHASTSASQGLTAPTVSGEEGSNGSSCDVGGGAEVQTSGDIQSKSVESHMRSWGPVLEGSLAAQGIDGTASHVTGGAGGLPGMAALQLLSHLAVGSGSTATGGTTAAGMGASTSTTVGGSNALRLPKPRNNIRQTSSSFVQRLQTHAEFAKLLAARSDSAQCIERHAFISRSRMLFWVGETSSGWLKEPLARLTFSNPITTHDINQQTRSPTRLDILLGFGTSDIVWLEAVSLRYSRINKAGCINEAPITSIRWVPGSETLFLSTHSDGTCTLLDITRDDSQIGSWAPVSGLSLDLTASDRGLGEEEQQEVLMQAEENARELTEAGSMPNIKSWDPVDGILVTKPPAMDTSEASRKAWSKLNPVAHWRIARSVAITDVAFSPDHTKLAVIATDGALRLINLLTETLLGTFKSYYGAMNRVVWSPDAKFLLTAGCDDLVSVWTNEGRLLSRCLGHTSFVTGLAFDPWKWRIEDRTYRFVSVGEDGKIFLWDFSSAALHRPRLPHSAHSNRKNGSILNDQHGRRTSYGGNSARRSSVPVNEYNGRAEHPLFHPACARGEVAELQPVASYQLGPVQTNDLTSTNGIVPMNNNNSAVPENSSSSSTGTSFGVGALSVLTGSANAANVLTGAQANGAANGQMASNAVGGQAQAAVNPTNEPGAANDLLVDVRCRPDGIVVLHKSGTMRYLIRPTKQSSLPQTVR